MSTGHLQDVLQKMSSRRFQDVYQVKLFLATLSRRLRDVFKTFMRRATKTVTNRRFFLVTLLGNLWSVYKI